MPTQGPIRQGAWRVSVATLIAGQLRKPSGFLGRHVVARIRNRRRFELRCASVDALPYADGEFTKACTVNTVYVWPDPKAALGEIRRTLQPGGRLVVTFNPPATARKLPYTKYGFALYEPEQMRALLEDAGFRDVEPVAGSSRLGEFFCAAGMN